MNTLRTLLVWLFSALLGLSCGAALAATEKALLQRFLAPDGTLLLPPGFAGSLDPGEFRMHLGAGGQPRFLPAVQLPDSAKDFAQSAQSAAKLFGVPDGCDDDIRAILRAPSGLIYLAGDFTICEDVRAPHVVAYDPRTRRFQALGLGNASGVGGTVFALALVGENLYVGGAFENAGGQPASRIARWDGTTWSTLGSGDNNGVLGQARALAVAANGDLLVGGDFSQAGGTPARAVARWNGNSWSALGSGVAGAVNALVVSGSQLYAGGDFSVAGGVSATNIARWDGQAWSALGSGAGNRQPGQVVYALAAAGDDLYVGGGFAQAGGQTVNSVARWNGSSWSALGSGDEAGVDNEVLALAVSGSDVYVGGAFLQAGSQPANRIARWNGSAWSALGGVPGTDVNGVDAAVNAISVSGNEVHAVGRFTSADGVRANRFALFDGQRWLALGSGTGSGVNGFIFALAVWRNQLYVGGNFSQAGGQPANAIASWNGSSWSSLGSGEGNGVRGEVNVLTVQGDALIVAGAFDGAGGQPANNIARWNGATWSPLGEGTNATIGALTVLGNDLYAGGLFDQAGGSPASLVARWDGSRWTALGSGLGNPASADFVVALTSAGGQLYAGGKFTRAGNTTANYVARWDGSQWSALGSGTDFYVYTLATIGSNLYAGGAFTMAGGSPAGGIARWDGSRWNALGTGELQGVSNVVSALAVTGTELYVGGSFDRAGDQFANGLARWNGSQWTGLGLDGPDQIVTALVSDGSNLFVNGTGLSQTPLPQLQSASSGGAADGESSQAAVSRSAEVVVFSSKANNLVADERNPRADIYLRSLSSGVLQRVSDLALALSGNIAQDFEHPSLSADGSVVAFQGSSGQVYSAIGGAAHALAPGGNGRSANPATSADGNSVAYESTSSNLSPLDGNGASSDVFLSNVQGTVTELISVGPGNVAGNGPSFAPAPNANGSVVGFVSLASNLTGVAQAAKASTFRQVLIRTAASGGVAAVAYASVNLATGELGNGDSDGVRLTPDGRFGVFQSLASNLVSDDSNGVSDVFRFEVVDRRLVRLDRVSRSSLGQQGNGASRNPSISDDGRFVTFETDASNLVGLDLNGRTDVLVYSVQTGETLRLSRTTDGAQPNGGSNRPAISGDGSTIVFDSSAGNLAAGDSNGVADVFLVALGEPQPKLNFSGAWYDPAQGGHGLFMEQLPEDRLLAWWFTFDPQGRQAWFGGVGTITGTHAVLPVTRTDGPGGRFIPNFNSSQVQNVPFGTLTIDFSDCLSGQVKFDLGEDFGRGGMDLVRLTQPDDVGGCRSGAVTGKAAGPVNNATGAWYDPNQAGQGLFLESLADGRLLAWWFTFNPGGGQAWFGGVGNVSGGGADFTPLKTIGGRWIPNFDPRLINNQEFGSMRIQFSSCTDGLVSFDLLQGFGRGSMVLKRLTAPLGQVCQ